MSKDIHFLPVQHFSSNVEAIATNEQLHDFEVRVADFFKKKAAYFTSSGRHAMTILFDYLKLKPDDEIFVTTSFGFPNISSCVTCTIFNYCKPSRMLSTATKAIFIIHEFGIFHPETVSLVEYGRLNNIPVIEDCAHSIFTFDDDNNQTGSVADYTIVTLPKIFPVQAGGFLVSNTTFPLSTERKFDTSLLKDALLASKQWDTAHQIGRDRKKLFNYFHTQIKSEYFKPLIGSNIDFFPWFFPIVSTLAPGPVIEKLRANAIDAGLWHGTNIVVLPLHQYLMNEDVEYMCALLNSISA